MTGNGQEQIYERDNNYGSGWVMERRGNSFTFTRTVTLNGSTQDIDIVLPFKFRLDRVEQQFNDATARTWALRIFRTPNDTTYSELQSATASTSLSSVTQLGLEYQFTPYQLVRLEYSASTNGKTVQIVYQVEKL